MKQLLNHEQRKEIISEQQFPVNPWTYPPQIEYYVIVLSDNHHHIRSSPFLKSKRCQDKKAQSKIYLFIESNPRAITAIDRNIHAR